MDFKKMFDLWKKVITQPARTFKQQRKKANLSEGAKHIVVAGVISGVIATLLGLAGLSAMGMENLFGLAVWGTAGLLALVIILPIMGIIGWLINSGIFYVISLLLGGKGNYTLQSYLIALYSAPIMVITYLFIAIPILGWVILFLISIYSLYLLTLALKETHKFSTGRAVLVWLLPIIIVVVLILIFAVAILGMLLAAGLGSSW